MIKKQGTILIVDDNRNILTTVRMLLEPIFDGIITIANPNSIPAKLREEHPDVVLLDMNFSSGINSGNEGLYWLREIKSLSPKTEVVLFTAYADIQLAVTGIKEGAADFIVKPFENEKMIRTLVEARDKNRAVDNVINRKGGKPGGKDAQSAMYWGDSEVMNNLRSIVEKVAATDANILITGENGTGKEVLANEIHRLSTRCGKKMLPVDMGAITETLFESELFGHVKGAFTDAKVDKPGKFELADGSTIFLDEIGNLSYSLQAKLLTALQRRSIVRVGGSKQIPINVRLVCATNRNLQQMVNDGEFREDLLYRINTIHLELPALRQRKSDIVPLVGYSSLGAISSRPTVLMVRPHSASLSVANRYLLVCIMLCFVSGFASWLIFWCYCFQSHLAYSSAKLRKKIHYTLLYMQKSMYFVLKCIKKQIFG